MLFSRRNYFSECALKWTSLVLFLGLFLGAWKEFHAETRGRGEASRQRTGGYRGKREAENYESDKSYELGKAKPRVNADDARQQTHCRNFSTDLTQNAHWNGKWRGQLRRFDRALARTPVPHNAGSADSASPPFLRSGIENQYPMAGFEIANQRHNVRNLNKLIIKNSAENKAYFI